MSETNQNNKETFTTEDAVDLGFLEDWYLNSIANDSPPVWTIEHLRELIGDFYLIPKED